MSESLSRGYFEDVYANRDDPWGFASSEYEAGKYAETIATLPKERYANALEIGSSIGVLTSRLSERCDRLLSIDIAQQAIDRAKTRCAGLKNVTFERRSALDEFPEGRFDLTVVSEVGYYFGLTDLAKVADQIAAHSAERAQLLLVHWLPFVHDYPLTGDQVHELFLERPEWTRVTSLRRELYRIDLLELIRAERSE